MYLCDSILILIKYFQKMYRKVVPQAVAKLVNGEISPQVVERLCSISWGVADYGIPIYADDKDAGYGGIERRKDIALFSTHY